MEPPNGYIHSFSNGTEFDVWVERNCEGCALAGNPMKAGSSRCPMFEMVHDREDFFKKDLAIRAGWRESDHMWGRCQEKVPLCPECEAPLELWANGENGPSDDRWACDACGVEYPHTQFPLPPNYVRTARALARKQREDERRANDLWKLEAWNRWARQ